MARSPPKRERIRLMERLVAAAARLNPRGYVSDLEYRRREAALLEQRQNLDALGQQSAARRNQLTEQRSALEQLPIVVGGPDAGPAGELSTLEQRIAEINGRRAYVIRAPVAGRVSALQAMVGRPATAPAAAQHPARWQHPAGRAVRPDPRRRLRPQGPARSAAV